MKNNEKYNKEELLELTVAQKELTFLDFPHDENDLVNMLGFHSYVENNCNLDALEKCWNEVVRLNDSLRLRIVKGLNRKQYIISFEFEKLERVKVDGRKGFDELEKQERSKAVWMYGPLTRATLVDCGDGAGGLIVCMHNICCDGYSMGLMFEELEDLYAELIRDGSFSERKEYSYVEYIREEKKYMQSNAYKKDCEWWKKKYKSIKDYCVPAGKPDKNFETALVTYDMPESLYKKLVEFCDEKNIAMNSMVMSFMALVVFKITGKKSFNIFNLSHGRRTKAMRNTVGCITQANPVFFYMDDNQSFEEFATKEYVNYLESLQHGRLPSKNHFIYGMKNCIKADWNFDDNWLYFSPMEFGDLEEKSQLGLEVFDESELETQFYSAIYDIPQANTLRVELNYQKYKYSSEEIDNIKAEFHNTIDWCLCHKESMLSQWIMIEQRN